MISHGTRVLHLVAQRVWVNLLKSRAELSTHKCAVTNRLGKPHCPQLVQERCYRHAA